MFDLDQIDSRCFLTDSDPMTATTDFVKSADKSDFRVTPGGRYELLRLNYELVTRNHALLALRAFYAILRPYNDPRTVIFDELALNNVLMRPKEEIHSASYDILPLNNKIQSLNNEMLRLNKELLRPNIELVRPEKELVTLNLNILRLSKDL